MQEKQTSKKSLQSYNINQKKMKKSNFTHQNKPQQDSNMIFIEHDFENQNIDLQESFIDYFGNGDSMDYIQQFLAPQNGHQQAITPRTHSSDPDFSSPDFQNQFIQPDNSRRFDQKKTKRLSESPYHNFQKHLFQILRHLVKFPKNPSSQISQISENIWKQYLSSQRKTKKALRVILSERWAKINQAEIQSYGQLEIYQTHGDEKIKIAQEHLRGIVHVHLEQQNIREYINHSRIRDKERILEYILLFKQEVDAGFVKGKFNGAN